MKTYEEKKERWLVQKDRRVAALPEMFRKIKINFWIQFFVMRHLHFVKMWMKSL